MMTGKQLFRKAGAQATVFRTPQWRCATGVDYGEGGEWQNEYVRRDGVNVAQVTADRFTNRPWHVFSNDGARLLRRSGFETAFAAMRAADARVP